MQRQNYIDINKSIKTGYLSTLEKKDFWFYGDFFFTIIVLCNMTFFLCMLIDIELKIATIPDRIFTVILSMLLVLCIYAIYRKAFEYRLSDITHNLTRTSIKRIIYNHLTDIDKSSIIETKEIYRIKKVKSYYYIEYVFIITKDKTYFNITNHFTKLNPPILFSHIFLKRDLQRLVNQALSRRNTTS